MENNSKQRSDFTEEQRANILELGNVLRDIHNRMLKDGYFLEDGRTWNIFKVGTVLCTVEWEDDF